MERDDAAEVRRVLARAGAAAGEGYRTFDHTGDLGLEVEAASPERLHALAVVAVMAQVAQGDDAPCDAHATLALDGDDPADLFVHFLNSALLEGELQQAVWTCATVAHLDARTVRATLEGQRLDPRRHVMGREIKAISHHHLELVLAPPRCRARLVLDL